MADLSVTERLQPSLLDRLTDEEPGLQHEPAERRVMTSSQLRASVLRDLTWLLNSPSHLSEAERQRHPEAARSVINFGIPDLTGRTASSIRAEKAEQMVKEAILAFEPRIIADTLEVKLTLDQALMGQNTLTFHVRGELWAQPVPLQILLETQMELEVGNVKVIELSGDRRA